MAGDSGEYEEGMGTGFLPPEHDARYPYTYACDLIRTCAEYDGHGCRMSRSEASLIRQLVSKVLGLPDEEVARKLADYFLKNEQALANAGAEKCLAAINALLGVR